jgi:hypothetical protein
MVTGRNTCTGECETRQGCQCLPILHDAVPEPDQDDLPHEPLTDAERAALVLIWTASVSIVMALAGYFYARVFG